MTPAALDCTDNHCDVKREHLDELCQCIQTPYYHRRSLAGLEDYVIFSAVEWGHRAETRDFYRWDRLVGASTIRWYKSYRSSARTDGSGLDPRTQGHKWRITTLRLRDPESESPHSPSEWMVALLNDRTSSMARNLTKEFTQYRYGEVSVGVNWNKDDLFHY